LRCRDSTVKIGVQGRGRTKKWQRTKQSSNFLSVLSYYDRTYICSSKRSLTEKYEICLEIKNVLYNAVMLVEVSPIFVRENLL